MQTLTRTRRIHSGMADEMILMAVEQFLPSVGAGALITVRPRALCSGRCCGCSPACGRSFSASASSPRADFCREPMIAAGAWYLLTGLVCIALGDTRALSPWTMGIPYGVGQLLVAAILLFSSKEDRDEI